MKSIIQEKDGTCFLCRILHEDYSYKYTEEHHIIFCKKQRPLSEKYGLKCHLCPGHHRIGEEAAHVNKDVSEILYKTAQIAFERKWGQERFFKVFGQNWLSEEERERMNRVDLLGRLTRDPEIRYKQGENPLAVARWTLAVNRRVKQGQQEADFINCVAFGRTAEFVERNLKKGSKIAVSGRIQTGSYTNKDGTRVYVTEVVVEEVEPCESKNEGNSVNTQSEDGFMSIPDGVDEELPFC